jgi:hypothetical protein
MLCLPACRCILRIHRGLNTVTILRKQVGIFYGDSSDAIETLVGNVINVLATCHPDVCCSRIFEDIFNVTDTMTGSQIWSHVGEIPRHDMCEASTKLVCHQWTSLSVTLGTVTLPTHQQTSLWHVTTSAMVRRYVSKNGGLPTQHDTNISN